MESLIEKITLYDVIGYGIPGMVLLTIIVWKNELYLIPGVISAYENFSGIIIILFLIIGYVVGILISEISRIFVDSILKKLLEMKCIPQNEVNIVDLKEILNERKILKSQINDSELVEQHMKAMYSDIQMDAAYKRIHNYASAATMYKNMAMACFMGGIVFLGWSKVSWQVIVCIISALLFYIRWYRFENKKNYYTLLWFMLKYHKKQCDQTPTI